MDYGEWTENSRGTYNKWDGIARTTAQVCHCWNSTLILVWFVYPNKLFLTFMMDVFHIAFVPFVPCVQANP